MIKAIIFDCFGVLYRDNISMLYDIVPSNKQKDLHDIIRATDYGLLTRQEYYQKIANLSNKTTDQIIQIEKNQHVRDDNVISYATSLRNKYKVAVLSNIDEYTMNNMFPRSTRKNFFDEIFISGELGMLKPNPEIFEYAAKQLNCRVDECIMIDDLIKNVEGANQAGMHGLIFLSLTSLKKELPQLIKEIDARTS